jgi:predicted HicB family RNase H-like nuclease
MAGQPIENKNCSRTLVEPRKLPYLWGMARSRKMSPRRESDRQWNLVVDAKLDKAARAAAKEAGLTLSAWIRLVVRKQLGLPLL